MFFRTVLKAAEVEAVETVIIVGWVRFNYVLECYKCFVTVFES